MAARVVGAKRIAAPDLRRFGRGAASAARAMVHSRERRRARDIDAQGTCPFR
jgi:hypothetical protein